MVGQSSNRTTGVHMLSIRTTAGHSVAAEDVRVPTPAPDQAVVAVRASSINRGELALIAARGQGWSPGQDVAGVVVVAASDGSGPARGARVVGLAEQGAWSERVVVTATRLAVIPDGIDYAVAASLPMAGLTALRTVRSAGSLLGRHVVITGASGGVGRFQTRLAQLAGARVTALTRAPDTIAGARVVTDLQQTEPADAALDSVGGAVLRDVVTTLRPGATLVWLGSTSGRPAPLSIYDFIGHEGVTIHTYFSYAGDSHDDSADLAYLLALVAEGHLTPDIAASWPLHRASDAVAQLEAGDVRGKIVLVAQDEPV